MDIHGIIFDIKKYAIHDGPGIRTTVFLKGCPMNCWWCHNPESQNGNLEFVDKISLSGKICPGKKEAIGKEVSVSEVIYEIEKDRIFYDESQGGVTFSGGEPLMQPEFLLELLRRCKELGLHTALDTAGCISKDIFSKTLDLVDLYLFDIKFISDEKHKKYTGISNKEILENLLLLSEFKKEIIIRIPIIPTINNTKDELEKIGNYLSKLEIKRIELLPYHKIGEEKYHKLNKLNRMKDIHEPTLEELTSAKEQLESFNIEVKIEV